MYIAVYMSIDNKPFPVRLGELKKPLQIEAVENDRSLHYVIKKILQKYVADKENVKWPIKKETK